MLENRVLPYGSAYLAEPYSPTSVHRQSVGIEFKSLCERLVKQGFLDPKLNLIKSIYNVS